MFWFKKLDFLKYDEDLLHDLCIHENTATDRLRALDDIDLAIAYVYEATRYPNYCEPLELIDIVEGWNLALTGWEDKKLEIKQYAIKKYHERIKGIDEAIKQYRSDKIKYNNKISDLEKEVDEYKNR